MRFPEFDSTKAGAVEEVGDGEGDGSIAARFGTAVVEVGDGEGDGSIAVRFGTGVV